MNTTTALVHPDRSSSWNIPRLFILALSVIALAFAGVVSLATPAAAVTLDQCNGVGPGPAGATTGMDCTVTVVNSIVSGVTSSTTTLTRTCSLDQCPGGNGTFTTTSTSLVTQVTQCNGSDNDAAHPITCTVDIINNISADTPGVGAPTAATVNQCVGTGTGGGKFGATGPLVCDPFPASTSGATVTQCNGSVTGGGSTADCSVASGSSVSPALPVSINQCNGTGNAGGTLLTCRASIRTNITAAVPSPTPTPVATVIPVATPTPTPTATPTARPTPRPTARPTARPTGKPTSPQISATPNGGVATGEGPGDSGPNLGLLAIAAGMLLVGVSVGAVTVSATKKP